MKYFRYFPVRQRDFFEQKIQSIDIVGRAKLIEKLNKQSILFYDWHVMDGERADIIAHKYYGSSDYTWLIWIANGIIDPFAEWPMDYNQLQSHLIKKYGSIALANSTILFYRNSDGLVVNSTEPGATAVSAFVYEVEENDKKRNIKLIDNSYRSQITDEIKRIFANS